jgi:DNA helicase-2/ATP-dependent DNA helicase PcrA
MDFLKNLNDEQKEAVLHLEGPVLVIAGPGSGKTRVIEYRVLHLLEKGISPSRILLLTFTRKAAEEMLKRVALHNKSGLYVEGGTFHSFAYKIIKKYGDDFYSKNHLTILDENDSEDLISKVLKELHFRQEEIPKKDTLKNIFSLKINKNLSLEEVLEKYYSQFLENIESIRKVEKEYEKRKKENNYVDFDDLLILLRNILKSPRGKEIASLYDFVMVDEYQDTNFLQGEITYLLGKHIKNILVVGDDAQSIYAFRGASHKNIMLFPEMFPQAKIIKLEKNYRSTQSILDLSNAILFNMEEKFKKNLVSAKGILGKKPLFLSFPYAEEEAFWIVNKVLELKEKGVDFKKQAILFRSNYVSIVLQTALSKAKIPFKVFGGIRFYEMSHIKDFLAFLKVLANPKDEISWGRILSLFEGVGKKTTEVIVNFIRKKNNKEEIIKVLNGEELKLRKKGSLQELGILFTKLKLENKPTFVLNEVLDFYLPFFKEKFDDWPQRLQDLKTLIEISSNYTDIESFLADISVEIPENLKEEKDFLTLSTIHSAKGLEWEIVFVIGLQEGVLPSARAKDKEELDEEERLLYVAVTRAKEELYLSFNFQNRYWEVLPTRFLLRENVFQLLEYKDLSGRNFFNRELENFYLDENNDLEDEEGLNILDLKDII